jgi:hypothetical protein
LWIFSKKRFRQRKLFFEHTLKTYAGLKHIKVLGSSIPGVGSNPTTLTSHI